MSARGICTRPRPETLAEEPPARDALDAAQRRGRRRRAAPPPLRGAHAARAALRDPARPRGRGAADLGGRPPAQDPRARAVGPLCETSAPALPGDAADRNRVLSHGRRSRGPADRRRLAALLLRVLPAAQGGARVAA